MMIKKHVKLNDRYCLMPGVMVSNDEGGEVTVLNARRGRYWRGNESARIALELLKEPTSPARIAEELLAQYDVSQEQAASHVVELVADLVRAGLARKA